MARLLQNVSWERWEATQSGWRWAEKPQGKQSLAKVAALATVALSLCPVAWPGLEVDSLMRVNEEPLEPELRLQGSHPAGARGQGWGLPKGPLALQLKSEPRLWSTSAFLPLTPASSSHSTPALRHTKHSCSLLLFTLRGED